MQSETFKEKLALIFLEKYLEEENVCSADTVDEEILDNANQVANAVHLYVNAMLAAHEGQKIEIKPQVQAVAKLLGYSHE